jgi:hypothetical protein
MKAILTTALLLVSFISFSQNRATTTSAPAQTTTSKFVNTWTLTQTEVFGDIHKPTADQAKDQLIIQADGHYRLIYNGVAEGGTWAVDKTNTMLTLTKEDGTIKKFKVLEFTATSLKVDYRDATEIHNILYYLPTASNSK